MKAVNKNIFREISRTKNRFLSIFTICAIGVGFFSGVRATNEMMKVSADDYYDGHDLFDLRVLSTFGLTDGDAAAIAEIDGVSGVYTSKYTDLALRNGEREFLTRVYSWNNDEVNRIDIVEGRAPQADNECIVNFNVLKGGIELGDTVTMADLTDAEDFPLNNSEYTVVGIYNTPMFISVTQRGSTTVGDGVIDAFMYVTKSNFTQEVYTEIYVTSDELKGMQSYSAEYEELRDRISDRLEELGKERSEIRYDEVVGDAEREIADGEEELAQAKIDGRKELDDAKAELADAEQQIADGEKELADAKAELDDGAAQLADAEEQLADAKKQLDDGWAELNDNKVKLDEAAQTLADSKKEIDEGEKQLADAKKQLDDSKAQLDAAQAEVNAKSEELSQGKAALEQAKQQLADGQAQYDLGKQQYEQGLAQYNDGKAQLEQAEIQLEQAEQLYGKDNPQLQQQRAQLEAQKQALEQTGAVLEQTRLTLGQTEQQLTAAAEEIAANEKTISDGEAQLAAAQKQIDEGYAQYNAGLAEYNSSAADFAEGKKKYEDGLAEYNDGLAQYNEGVNTLEQAQRDYDSGAAELAEKRAEYEDGVKKYNDGAAELEDAKQKYSDGLIDYAEGEEKFNTEIADAEKELADAREKISDAGEAKWYIFLRDDNAGYAEYDSNSERIGKIASIFPVFFLLVAALVCLTTMSRMVEEQRTQIGTLKALGYSNATIMRHYMTYAVTAAAVGSILGAFAGVLIFPTVIIYAYSMLYNITEIHYLYNISNILISVGSMVAAIALTVFFTSKKVLKETPASLMRPKAPKAGKRVLIERIGFIWNRMGFFGKVSGRNLFRYKRRMFMTVIGIAGCTALSLTGFGLKDSIGDIVNLQYNSIYKYNGYLAYDSDITDEELESIYSDMNDYCPDTLTTRALIKQYTLTGSGTTIQAYVTCVEDAEVFGQMIDLHERVSGEKLSLSDGIIATEKTGRLLGRGKGETARIRINDSEERDLTISGLTEHYVGNYLYMTSAQYEEIFGRQPEYNIIYFYNGITESGDGNAFSEKMLKNDAVLSVMMNSSSSSTFSDTIKIMDLVVMVLIVSAGALAFVVLYNLTNVNITERIREIATLKVLGFYDREVSSYVFRENIILSVMGAAVGLGLGTALCMFVITTAEIDEVMFGRSIHLLSYVWAFLVTIVFSLVVNLIMTNVLKKISMVESLKSVE
ncbi:MAG: FtsX-like permease family protein [Oscillospiraceae bacterium]